MSLFLKKIIDLKSERGSIFLITLMTGTISVLLLASFISWVMLELDLTGRSYSSAGAIALAEAGVEMGIWELNYNGAAWASPWADATDPNTGAVIPNTKRCTVTGFATQAGQAMGDFTVTVSNIGSMPVIIEAVGSHPSSASPTTQRTVKVKLQTSLFQGCGMFSIGDLELGKGIFTDSYDSRLGFPYASATIGSEGNLGSNGNVTVDGNAGNPTTINGDLIPGPGHTATSSGGSITITGSTSAASTTAALPPVTLPTSGYTELGGFTGGTLTAGTYIADSIDVTGTSQLTIPSNNIVTIYIRSGGDMKISGNGVVNDGGIPTNLRVYAVGGGGSRIMFNGNPTVCAAIYAPNSEGKFVGADVVIDGALAVGTCDGNNHISIHHDIACDSLLTPFARPEVYSWQEQ